MKTSKFRRVSIRSIKPLFVLVCLVLEWDIAAAQYSVTPDNFRERITEAGYQLDSNTTIDSKWLFAIGEFAIAFFADATGGDGKTPTLQMYCNRYPNRRLTAEEVLHLRSKLPTKFELDGSLTYRMDLPMSELKSSKILRELVDEFAYDEVAKLEWNQYHGTTWTNGAWFNPKLSAKPLDESRIIFELELQDLITLATRYWGKNSQAKIPNSQFPTMAYEASGVTIFASLRSFDFWPTGAKLLRLETIFKPVGKLQEESLRYDLKNNYPWAGNFCFIERLDENSILYVSNIEMSSGVTLRTVNQFAARFAAEMKNVKTRFER